MNQKGISLIHIIMIAFVIAVLASIAVPNFVNARRKSDMYVCVHQLRTLKQAKKQWALYKKQPQGADCHWDDVKRFLVRPISYDSCPAGGRYRLGVLGDHPTCDFSDEHAM